MIYFVLGEAGLTKLHVQEARERVLVWVKARQFWSTPAVLEVSDNRRLSFVTGGCTIQLEVAKSLGERLSGATARAVYTRLWNNLRAH